MRSIHRKIGLPMLMVFLIMLSIKKSIILLDFKKKLLHFLFSKFMTKFSELII